MISSREVWDSRYRRNQANVSPSHRLPWLELWEPLLDRYGEGLVLDLGCGRGGDALYLTSRGHRVLASDFARSGLAIARVSAPDAHFCQLDLSMGLPFRDCSFEGVVANLSLHYFAWLRTLAIVKDIRRCLWKGGHIFCRVNSIADVHHGAEGHPQIEPGLFSVGSIAKRFFDEEDVRAMFEPPWKLLRLEEYEVNPGSDTPKIAWEAVAQRTG